MATQLLPWWPGTILSHVLHASDTTALCEPQEPPLPSRQISHFALARHVGALQRALAEFGVRPQERVLMIGPNSTACITTLLAIMAQGAVPVPLDPEIAFVDLLHSLHTVQPQLALVVAHASNPIHEILRLLQVAGIEVGHILPGEPPCFVAPLRTRPRVTLVPPREETVAVILHTAGTTGRSKAVALTHQHLIHAVRAIGASCRMTWQDRGLLVIPLWHSQGLVSGVLAPLAAGGSIVVRQIISAEIFWHDVKAYSPSWYTATPHVHAALVSTHQTVPISSPFHFVRSSGANLSQALAAQLTYAFRAPVVEAYGLTEAADCVIPRMASKRELQYGRPVVEIAVVAPKGLPGTRGIVWIRGSTVTTHYLDGHADLVADGGWVRTGDLGYQDASGSFWLWSREGEEISAGDDVFVPDEVERVAEKVDGVLEVCAFPIPAIGLGTEGGLGLAVVTRPHQHDRQRQIRADLKMAIRRLRGPETPLSLRTRFTIDASSQIWFVPSLPRTVTGVVRRQQLMARFIGSGEALT